MERTEFFHYIKNHIREYLPDSYQLAEIDLAENIKHNDVHLTSIIVRRPQESIVPCIYLDAFFEEYRQGRTIKDCLKKMAEIRVRVDVEMEQKLQFRDFSHYDSIKDCLQIRVCDYEKNRERLRGKLYCRAGDFALTYHVLYDLDEKTSANYQVTKDVLSTWGVDEETVHKDALLADKKRTPFFINAEEMAYFMTGDSGCRNLLLENGALDMDDWTLPMFILTNQKMQDGAGLLWQEGMMEKISGLLGGDYYVLPSSVHELIILPASTTGELSELSEIVHTVNREKVEQEDRLSDFVQFYDSQAKELVNAEKWVREHKMDIHQASPALRELVTVSAMSAADACVVDKGTLPFGVLEALKKECKEKRLEPYVNFHDPDYDVVCDKSITERFDLEPKPEKNRMRGHEEPEKGMRL